MSTETARLAIFRAIPASWQAALKPVAASPFRARLARGAFWSVFGAVLSRGLTLSGWILVARMLGKSTFGQLGMTQSTIGMFTAFAGFGLGLTANRYVAEYRQRDPEKAGRIIAFSGLIAVSTGVVAVVALLTLAPLLAKNVMAAPQLAGLLRLGAVLLFFGTLNGAQIGALSGFEAFKTIAFINLSTSVLTFLFAVGGTRLYGLPGAIVALSLGVSVNWLLNHLALRKEAARASVPLKFMGCWKERGILWSFSLPVVLSGLLSSPIGWACSAMLVHRPDGYAELGAYNAAVQWQTALAFLPALLSEVILPILTDSHANHTAEQSRKTLSDILLLFGAIILLPAVVLISISGWIAALYGASFHLPGRLFVAVICYATLNNLGIALWTCLLSQNRAWYGFVGNLISGISVLISFHFLLPLGGFGLACANIIGYTVAMVIVFPPILRALFGKSKGEAAQPC